jgi:hypothetical protein
LSTDRVLYDANLFREIVAEAVKPAHESIFTTEDRIGFFQDTLAFSKAGLLSTSEVLELAYQMKNTDECKCLQFVEDGAKQMYTDDGDCGNRLCFGEYCVRIARDGTPVERRAECYHRY